MSDELNKVEQAIKKFNWSSLASFWEENPGEFSMTRLVMFLVFTVPIFCWLGICLYNRALAEMPNSILMLQSGVMTGKLVQKQQEK